MNNLSSIFEIYVGINSAYILSQHFTLALNTKITGVLLTVEERLRQVEGLLKSKNDYLTSINVPPVKVSKLQPLFDEQNKLIERFDCLKKETKSKVEEGGISSIFNFYCLFAALYSFGILLSNGFNDLNDHLCNQVEFFIYNCFIILIFARFFWNYRRNRKIIYFNKLFNHSGFLVTVFYVVSAWFFVLFCYLFIDIKLPFLPKCVTDNLDLINKLLATLIPIAHFLYYFFKAFVNKRTLSPKLLDSILAFEREIDVFGGKIDGTTSALNIKIKG